MCHESFLKKKWSGWVPRWSEGSRTPSATSTSSTTGSTASTIYIYKKPTWCMFIYYFSKINRFKMVPRWSLCSRTPLATSTNPTMGSTASTSYVHQKLTWHMFICYFSKTNRFKTVPARYGVIKRLSDTLSDLDKLNQGEYSKYHLCSSKIDMTHVYILFFKEVDQEALGHPQRPRQAHPWTSTQTVLILSQAGLSLLGHPHEPR